MTTKHRKSPSAPQNSGHFPRHLPQPFPKFEICGYVLAFPIGTVTVLQFVKEIICVTFMVFAIVASVKELGLGL